MDRQREEFIAKIKRLEDATKKTKSKYLKADYGKRNPQGRERVWWRMEVC